MGYKVTIIPLARMDLDQILHYIRCDLENPIAAAALMDAIDDCCDDLASMPLMYEQCRDLRLRALGYRRAVVKNYVMVYRVAEQEKTVYILRFFYGAQDYEALI